MPKRNNFNTAAILHDIYPKIANNIQIHIVEWKKCLSRFISSRSTMLFDSMPCDRILYFDNDRDDLFNSIHLDRHELEKSLNQTYYAKITKFKPSQAKDITTVVALCIIRYFLLKKDQKNLELALVYYSFSGKMYPSVHYGFFKLVAPSKYRHIMEYVVNNELSNKYELKTKGTIIGAIKSISINWIDAYKSTMFKTFDDEDVCYLIQQIHNRIKSFMKNIAKLYYDAYENKEYISYDKDALPEGDLGGDYHLTDNDSFKLQKYVEKTMQRINSSRVDYKTCKACADANVQVEEVRAIIESILNNPDNLKKIKEMVTNIIGTYMSQSPKKDIVSLDFFSFTIKPRPNCKDPLINRVKDIIIELLEECSERFNKRKHREPTKQSYIKSLLIYFTLTIINANK